MCIRDSTWSSACRTATHRQPRSSPRGARPIWSRSLIYRLNKRSRENEEWRRVQEGAVQRWGAPCAGRGRSALGCAGEQVVGLADRRSQALPCLLYTSDAADEEDSVDLGGRRI